VTPKLRKRLAEFDNQLFFEHVTKTERGADFTQFFCEHPNQPESGAMSALPAKADK
jgi:hypothetical protein